MKFWAIPVGERYQAAAHKVHIDYYPPRGDAKEAWDVIDFLGLFGLPMSLRLNLQGRDSILAAPLVLDLARWMIVLQKAGKSGLVPELGFYFKKPLGDNPSLTYEDQLVGLHNLEESCNRVLSPSPVFDTLRFPEEPGVKFGYSTNAFVKFPLIESVEKIAKLGFRGVEIMCDRPHLYPPEFGAEEMVRLQEVLQAWDLKVTNLNSFTLFAVGDTYLPSWIEPEKERRAIRIRHTLECLKVADRLGCRNISVPPGGPLNGIPETKGHRSFPSGIGAGHAAG